MAEENTFTVSRYMEANGLEFQGVDETGLAIGTSGDDEYKFDPVSFLKERGVDPENVNIEFNAPNTALQFSPLDAEQRLKLSVGNAKGNLNFLKREFGGAKLDPDNGLVVKKDGVWHTVDPSGLGSGDAWQKTQELGKDIVDLFDEAALTAGTIAGFATAGLAGGIAGSAATELMRTSLGRYVGTYEATFEEQAADVAIEGFLALGGEAIARGARPLLGQMWRAAKNMRNMPRAARDIYTGVIGKTTGVGSPAMNQLIDDTAGVAGMQTLLRRASDPSAMVDRLHKRSAGQLLKSFTEGVNKEWEEGMFRAAQSARGTIIPEQDILRPAMANFERNGFGKFVLQSEPKNAAIAAIGQPLDQLPANAKLVFRPLTNSEGATWLRANAGKQLPSEVDAKVINTLFNDTRKRLGKAPMKNDIAVRQLATTNSALNRMVREEFGQPAANATWNRMLTQFQSGFKTGISSSMGKLGVKAEWATMNQQFSLSSSALGEARKLINGKEANLSKFAENMLNANAKGVEVQNMVSQMLRLTGKRGESAARRIRRVESAKRFNEFLASRGFLSGLAGTIGAVGVAAGGVKAAVLAPFISPRVAGGITKLGLSIGRGTGRLAKENAGPVVQKFVQLASPSMKMAHQTLDFLKGVSKEHAPRFGRIGPRGKPRRVARVKERVRATRFRSAAARTNQFKQLINDPDFVRTFAQTMLFPELAGE